MPLAARVVRIRSFRDGDELSVAPHARRVIDYDGGLRVIAVVLEAGQSAMPRRARRLV